MISNNKFYLLLILILFSDSYLYSQCEGDLFFNNCSGQTKNHTFLKTFNGNVKKTKKGKDRELSFSYILSKGSMYILTACSDENNSCKMVVSLFDINHKLVTTSYNASTNKHYPLIGYQCNTSGMYYIKLTFDKEDAECCGLSILAFKKQ